MRTYYNSNCHSHKILKELIQPLLTPDGTYHLLWRPDSPNAVVHKLGHTGFRKRRVISVYEV